VLSLRLPDRRKDIWLLKLSASWGWIAFFCFFQKTEERETNDFQEMAGESREINEEVEHEKDYEQAVDHFRNHYRF
jgi:hypothetical protein